MCVADCATRTDGGARATAGCDIHSLAGFNAAADRDADLDFDAAPNLATDRAPNLDTDPAPDLNAVVAHSTGHCC